MNKSVKEKITEKLQKNGLSFDYFMNSMDSNDDIFSVFQADEINNSPLKGKVIYFLGSSVTVGAGSRNEGMGDFIAKRNGCKCPKEAVSSTTLAAIQPDSYVERMLKTDKFNKNEKIDAFICQLSTNDMYAEKVKDRGTVDGNQFDGFDKNTTYGAIEYIISYVKDVWDCPVFFYTGSYFESEVYTEMTETLKNIKSKWDGKVKINIIDLYCDSEFNDIGEDLNKKIMIDPIHPSRAGYQFWWVPKFEEEIKKGIG